MTYKLRIREKAAGQSLAAKEYYSSIMQSLGQSFADELLKKISIIADNPEFFPVVDEFGHRRKLLDKFPYAIYYLFKNNKVYIRAIIHYSVGKSKQTELLK